MPFWPVHPSITQTNDKRSAPEGPGVLANPALMPASTVRLGLCGRASPFAAARDDPYALREGADAVPGGHDAEGALPIFIAAGLS